jgi:hypothetical protein
MVVVREVLFESDRRLHPLLRSEGSAADREIEAVIIEARAVIDAVLSRYRRSDSLVSPEDADDLRASIHLRLFEKLRALCAGTGEPILNLQGYVATLTYNAVSDFMRSQFPERARLKKRVRYALTTDARLAMWHAEAGLTAGLAEWAVRAGAASIPTTDPGGAASSDTAQAIVEVLHETREPVLVDRIVDVLHERRGDQPSRIDADAAAVQESPGARIEDRDFAYVLWEEIRQLRPGQRKALLLNLRYGGDLDVITVLVMSGIATFAELADALEMTYKELMSVWSDLPLDDARIAEMLHLTRQQVINLRKAARDRLSRRLPR